MARGRKAKKPSPSRVPGSGGSSFKIHPWPEWLRISPDFEPGEIVTYQRRIPIEGYSYISRRLGREVVVPPYVRLQEVYYRVPGKACPEFSTKPSWLTLETYMERKYKEWERFEVQDPIYRKEGSPTYIDSRTLFMWHRRLPNLSMSSMDAGSIALVRVWILLYNSNEDKYFVFCRTRSVNFAPESTQLDLGTCYDAHVCNGFDDPKTGQEWRGIYRDILDWSETKDYIEVREILAWTVFNIPRRIYEAGYGDREKAPYILRKDRHRKRSRKRS